MILAYQDRQLQLVNWNRYDGVMEQMASDLSELLHSLVSQIKSGSLVYEEDQGLVE